MYDRKIRYNFPIILSYCNILHELLLLKEIQNLKNYSRHFINKLYYYLRSHLVKVSKSLPLKLKLEQRLNTEELIPYMDEILLTLLLCPMD